MLRVLPTAVVALGLSGAALAASADDRRSGPDLVGFMTKVRDQKPADEFTPALSQDAIFGSPFHVSIPAQRKADGGDATKIAYWSYDLAEQTLEVRVEVLPYYRDDIPTVIENSLRGPYLSYRSAPTGSYMATNGYGAEFEVVKVDAESFTLLDDRESALFPAIRHHVLRLPMAPEVAREVTSKLTLELHGKVASDGKPVVGCGVRQEDATFRVPVKLTERVCGLRVHLERMRLVAGDTTIKEWSAAKSD